MSPAVLILVVELCVTDAATSVRAHNLPIASTSLVASHGDAASDVAATDDAASDVAATGDAASDVAAPSAPVVDDMDSRGESAARSDDGTDASAPIPLTLPDRTLLAAIAGVAAFSATLFAASATFAVTVALLSSLPGASVFLALPFVPLSLFFPPIFGALAAGFFVWPETDLMGVAIVVGAALFTAVPAFVISFILTAPLLATSSTGAFSPGGGGFEIVILAHVLGPPVAVGLAAATASFLVANRGDE